MFLIRAAFWLGLVLLILPTNEDTQKEVVGAAQAAFNDFAGFCLRNPEVCENGRQAAGRLTEKAMFGARLLTNLVSGATTEVATASSGEDGDTGAAASTVAAAQAEPAHADEPERPASASNTLSESDFKPVWRKPRGNSGV